MPGSVKPPQRGKGLPSLTPTGDSEALGTVMPDFAVSGVRDEYVRVGNPAQRFLISWGDLQNRLARFEEETPTQRDYRADLTRITRTSHHVLANVLPALLKNDEMRRSIEEFLESPPDDQNKQARERGFISFLQYCRAISRVLDNRSISDDASNSLALGLLWHELANRLDSLAQFDYEAEAAERRSLFLRGYGAGYSEKELKNRDQARALRAAHFAYDSAQFLRVHLSPTGIGLMREAAKRLAGHGAFRSAALALALTVQSESKFGERYQGTLPPLEDDLALLTGKTPWQVRLNDILIASCGRDPIQETSQPLSRLIPIHDLYQGTRGYLTTLQDIRQVMFIELLLRGWHIGELPNRDTLTAIMYDNGNLIEYQQVLPKISRPDSRGNFLVLNGHHRIAALITLVADGFLPAATLQDIPVDRSYLESPV